MPKSNKILTHKDQDSEYDKQRTNMGVRSGPKLPDRGEINVMTEDGTFNSSSGWTVTPGSLGDSDNWNISNGVATIDGSQSGTRWMIMDFPQNNYYKVIMTITRTAGTLSLSYATGGATSGTEMTANGTYTHGPHQVTGNDILYIRADSSFSGTITDVKVIQTDANGVPVSHLILCFDAMNAKSYAGEPSVSVGASYYRAAISTVPGETGLTGSSTVLAPVRGGKVRDGVDYTGAPTTRSAPWNDNHPRTRKAKELGGGNEYDAYINSGVDSSDWTDEAHGHYVFDKILKKPVFQMHPVTSPENYGTSNQGVNYGGWRAKSYGNGRSFSDMGIDSGTTYTFSWLQWSDQVGSYPQMGFYGQLEGGSTNGFHDGRSPSHQGQLIAGVWERKSWTISSAADWKQANIPSIYCYGYIGATTAASTIRITDIQVEVKGYNTPYIDKVPLTNTYEAHRLAANAWRDITENGNHGTLTNMVGTGTAHYKEGNIIRLGGPVTNGFNISNDPMYLDFDGSDDLVTTSFGNGRNPSTNPITYSFWVAQDGSGSDMFAVQGNWGSSGRAYFGVLNGYWNMGIHDDGWGDTASTRGPAVVIGKWTNVVIVFDGSAAKMYVNGLHYWDRAYSSYTFNQVLEIGGNTYDDGGTNYSWNGRIAKVSVFNAALSHKQVKQEFNQFKVRFGL